MSGPERDTGPEVGFPTAQAWAVHRLRSVLQVFTAPTDADGDPGARGVARRCGVWVLDPADPWLIRLDLPHRDGGTVSWALDRELLLEALTLDGPVGDGDVRLSVCRLPTIAHLVIELHPAGPHRAVLLADLDHVALVLRLSHRLTPPGAEPEVDDVELAQLLAGDLP